MTICCTQCGEYMGRGTKFNARQEEAIGMEWMGLKRWRFYLKCSSCCQEMTFLTDPENDHYVTEHGCTRNFEPWRVKEEVNKILNEKKKQIESDSIKSLENKSSIIKNQLDLMDTINDLQDINKKNAFINHDKIINQLNKKNKKRSFKQIDNENEKIKQFKQAKKQKISNHNNNDSKISNISFNFGGNNKDNDNDNNNDNNNNKQQVLVITKKLKKQKKKKKDKTKKKKKGKNKDKKPE